MDKVGGGVDILEIIVLSLREHEIRYQGGEARVASFLLTWLQFAFATRSDWQEEKISFSSHLLREQTISVCPTLRQMSWWIVYSVR